MSQTPILIQQSQQPSEPNTSGSANSSQSPSAREANAKDGEYNEWRPQITGTHKRGQHRLPAIQLDLIAQAPSRPNVPAALEVKVGPTAQTP